MLLNPQEMADRLEYEMIIQELLALFPLTTRLMASFSDVRIEGMPNLGCAACKLFNNVENPGVQEFIAPPNILDSMEHALRRYTEMGNDAPDYIKNLFRYDDSNLREEAVKALGSSENKGDDWLIFRGLAVVRALACPSPEHEMELLGDVPSPKAVM